MTHRRLFNIAALASSLLFVATFVLLDWSMDRLRALEFPWRDSRWEIAVGDGNLWIGNGPQVVIDQGKTEAVLKKLKSNYEWRRSVLHGVAEQAPYQSEAYQHAIDAIRDAEAAYQKEVTGVPRPQANRIEHSIHLSGPLLIFAVLPATWMVAALICRRKVLRELQRPMNVAVMLMLVLPLAIGASWIRSYWVGATWALGRTAGGDRTSTDPAVVLMNPWSASRWIILHRGQLQFYVNKVPAHLRFPETEQKGYHRGGEIVFQPMLTGRSLVLLPTQWTLPGVSYTNRPYWLDARGLTAFGYRSLIISMWLPWMVSIIFPLIWLRWRISKHRRERRLMLNLCSVCGYSLSGNTSGVCPECGVKVA